jgi:hypothetical protein
MYTFYKAWRWRTKKFQTRQYCASPFPPTSLTSTQAHKQTLQRRARKNTGLFNYRRLKNIVLKFVTECYVESFQLFMSYVGKYWVALILCKWRRASQCFSYSGSWKCSYWLGGSITGTVWSFVLLHHIHIHLTVCPASYVTIKFGFYSAVVHKKKRSTGHYFNTANVKN